MVVGSEVKVPHEVHKHILQRKEERSLMYARTQD